MYRPCELHRPTHPGAQQGLSFNLAAQGGEYTVDSLARESLALTTSVSCGVTLRTHPCTAGKRARSRRTPPPLVIVPPVLVLWAPTGRLVKCGSPASLDRPIASITAAGGHRTSPLHVSYGDLPPQFRNPAAGGSVNQGGENEPSADARVSRHRVSTRSGIGRPSRRRRRATRRSSAGRPAGAAPSRNDVDGETPRASRAVAQRTATRLSL